MAAQNMCNIARGYLQDLRRPDYLQPTDKNGALIWEQSAAASNSGTVSTSNSTTVSTSNSTTVDRNRRSRRATVPSSDKASGGTKMGGNRKRRPPKVSLIAFDVSMLIYRTSYECL
jgi:hypothetical protein